MTASVFASDVKFTPWWWEAAPPRPAREPALPREVDIAIIGSGYNGLSAALTLARAGRHPVVFEAGVAGAGASTRNGGQVGSGNQKFPFARLVELHGEDKAQALVREGVAMLDYIARLVAEENIDCHFERCGRFRGALLRRHYEGMQRDLEDLHRRAGVRYEMVPPERTAEEILSPRYQGGALLPDDASLHPGLYHRGLLERAQSAGALLLEHTPVVTVRSEGARCRVITGRGSIEAREVIVTTNGYTGRATPGLRARTVPVGSAVIATEELAPEHVLALMPRRRVYGETARVFHYFRPSPDGRRILFGGRIGRLVPQNSTDAYEHLYRSMVRIFPDIEGVKVTHCWSGHLGFTQDGFPHLGKQDGLWYALGYNGTGVSRSTWFGHKVALKVLGHPEGRTAFDELPFERFAFRFAAPVGVAAAESLYRVRDAVDARAG